MAVKVAINGLGRIGRCVARIIADRDDVELVAVNASGTEEMLQYNLKYDSVHGRRQDVSVSNGYLNIGETKAKIFAERDLSKIDFASCGAELVLECTGAFLTAESVQPYLDNGIKKCSFPHRAKMIPLPSCWAQMQKSMQVRRSFRMLLVRPMVWLPLQKCLMMPLA